MICYRCGGTLTESEICPECGENVALYKKVLSLSNVYYNDGLQKATVRNLSGAINSLQHSIKLNKNNIEARNLLGLVYYEVGEVVPALCEWVISKNLLSHDNRADDYMEELRNNPTHLDVVNQSVRKYNVALRYCEEGSLDVAVIQLKKILQSNPSFLAAHQLLGLLYLNSGSYSKAKKELTRALRIDNGSTKTRFYLQEAEKMLSPDDDDDKSRKDRTKAGDVIEYRSGNDTIIQPVHSMQPKGTVSLISVLIGLILGLLAGVFLVLPSRVQKVNDEASAKIAAISEEADLKSSLLLENQNTVDDLNEKLSELQATIDSYSESDVTVEAMNELMAAVDIYLKTPNDTETIAQHMDLVDPDNVEGSSSEYFKELYDTMIELVGTTLGDYYYKLGYKAYTSQEYDTAITDLLKAYEYDSTNEPALYFLGNAYYENGDYDKAKKAYNEVMSAFPDTKYASNAETKIAEINNLEE